MITRMGAAFPLLMSVVCSALAAQGQTSVKFDGYLQPRSEMVSDSAVFYLRRARVGLQGQASSWADYRLLTEWRSGSGGGSPLSVVEADGQLTEKPWAFVLGKITTRFSGGLPRQRTRGRNDDTPLGLRRH